MQKQRKPEVLQYQEDKSTRRSSSYRNRGLRQWRELNQPRLIEQYPRYRRRQGLKLEIASGSMEKYHSSITSSKAKLAAKYSAWKGIHRNVPEFRSDLQDLMLYNPADVCWPIGRSSLGYAYRSCLLDELTDTCLSGIFKGLRSKCLKCA